MDVCMYICYVLLVGHLLKVDFVQLITRIRAVFCHYVRLRTSGDLYNDSTIIKIVPLCGPRVTVSFDRKTIFNLM